LFVCVWEFTVLTCVRLVCLRRIFIFTQERFLERIKE
jgi:hypothetical protein